MSPQPVPKIPEVDFSKEDCWKPGTTSWLSTRNDICNALKEFGCFVALLPSKAPLELHNTFFGSLEDLFNFPVEIKTQSSYEKPYQGGYIPGRGAHESLGIGYATKPEYTRRFTNHFWPNGNDPFRESADLYAKVMEELDHVVTRMVYENYGVENYHNDHIQKYVYNFRFNIYNKEPEKTALSFGMPSHTDKTFTTILHSNHVKGLEIKSKDNVWIGFDPSPSSFIVMAGDAFQVWSNDRVRACLHRVALRENDVRFSFGLFAHKEGETKVQKELVDENHLIQYKPFNQFEYIDYFKKNYATLGTDYSIKAFCGV